jgi:hypothetical protein
MLVLAVVAALVLTVRIEE